MQPPSRERKEWAAFARPPPGKGDAQIVVVPSDMILIESINACPCVRPPNDSVRAVRCVPPTTPPCVPHAGKIHQHERDPAADFRQARRTSRRRVLQAGCLSALGLGLDGLLQHPPLPANSRRIKGVLVSVGPRRAFSSLCGAAPANSKPSTPSLTHRPKFAGRSSRFPRPCPVRSSANISSARQADRPAGDHSLAVARRSGPFVEWARGLTGTWHR